MSAVLINFFNFVYNGFVLMMLGFFYIEVHDLLLLYGYMYSILYKFRSDKMIKPYQFWGKLYTTSVALWQVRSSYVNNHSF